MTTGSRFHVALLIAVGACTPAPAQNAEAPDKPRVTERFHGPVMVTGPDGKQEVDASLQKWIVSSGTRVDLPRADRGAILVHLMAGSVTVIGQDGRTARAEGDRWTVPQDQNVAVEAGDDSAVLMLTILRPR